MKGSIERKTRTTKKRKKSRDRASESKNARVGKFSGLFLFALRMQ